MASSKQIFKIRNITMNLKNILLEYDDSQSNINRFYNRIKDDDYYTKNEKFMDDLIHKVLNQNDGPLTNYVVLTRLVGLVKEHPDWVDMVSNAISMLVLAMNPGIKWNS